MFSTEQQWTATLELKTEGVNIGHQFFCLSQELLQKIPKFRFFNFCFKFLLGIIFGPRKINKNIAFVGKERKETFLGETKGCSAKMLVGKVVPRKITEEFTFMNRTAV